MPLLLHEIVKAQLKEAHKQQKINAVAYCKQQPQFHFENTIWLYFCDIRTNYLCGKLDYCKLGPFFISKQINVVIY